MNIGLTIQEYINEINKSDLEANPSDLIIGLLSNTFKDYRAITEEILIQEIQHRLEKLREYNSHPEDEAA